VVGVDPVFRNRGYGTAMSVAALGWPARPARSRAQSIYERLGFVTVSRYQLFSL